MRKVIEQHKSNTVKLHSDDVIRHIKNGSCNYAVVEKGVEHMLVLTKEDTIILVATSNFETNLTDITMMIDVLIRNGVLFQVKIQLK